jgi:hypothetical protein
MMAMAMLLAPAGLRAADGPKPLFASDAPLHIIIQSAMFHANSVSRPSDLIDGTLTVDGAPPIPIKLGIRGITRRETDICQFPPLRVEFPAKPPEDSPFAGQKKLKLVTHCRQQAGFQQYLLLEYATYKMMNLVTPLSFRDRLVSVDYAGADGRSTVSRFGFFLEDADDVAKRNGMREAKMPARISPAQLDPAGAGRQAAFEYMVGNLDWSSIAGPAGAACCHNIKLVGAAGAQSGLVPLPYDYDFSGLVDAPYATPPQGINVPNVRVRMWRGYCRYNPQGQAAIADLLGHRDAILAIYDSVPQLDPATKAKATAYLGGFFATAASPDAMAKLLKGCIS